MNKHVASGALSIFTSNLHLHCTHNSTPTGEYEVDVAQDHSQASAAAAYVGGTATATAVGAPG